MWGQPPSAVKAKPGEIEERLVAQFSGWFAAEAQPRDPSTKLQSLSSRRINSLPVTPDSH